MANKKCRAYCSHSMSSSFIWYGPIRADKNLAEIDLKVHLKTCTVTQDSAIIEEGDPMWSDKEDKKNLF